IPRLVPRAAPATAGVSGPVPSVRLDAAEHDHLGPLLGSVDDQLFKVGGRARQRRTTHSGVGKRGVDLLSTDKGKPLGPWYVPRGFVVQRKQSRVWRIVIEGKLIRRGHFWKRCRSKILQL